MNNSTSHAELARVPFAIGTDFETRQYVLRALEHNQGGRLVTANLDYLRRSVTNAKFGDFVRQSELVIADGMPLVWASRLQRTPLPERVAGSTLCMGLAGDLAAAGRSLFLLGGNSGVAERAAEILQQRFPGLKIAGSACPPWGFDNQPAQIEAIRQQLIEAQPDVIYVALGSPKTEELIDRLQADLPRSWWIGIGISLSFITGDVRRAPLWVQRAGSEWVHRLWQEPRRLGRRYLIDGLPFAVNLLCQFRAKRCDQQCSPHGT